MGTCTLCDLPLADAAVESDDGEEFCCPGCLHVHETLADRDDATIEAGVDALEAEDHRAVPDNYETTYLRVDGMHCRTCETFVESRAGTADDIAAMDASYITDTVRVDHDPEKIDADELCELVSGHGYRAYKKDDPKGQRAAENRLMYRLIVGTVVGMVVMMHYIVLIYPTYFSGLIPGEYAGFMNEMLASPSAVYFYLVLGLLTSIILFYTGGPILKGALVSIRTRTPNMDLLVSIAAVSAWAYSTLAIFAAEPPPHLYYDVTIAVVMVVTAGGYYENQIKRRATERLADVTQAQVDTARRYDPDGAGTEVTIGELAAGDRLLVREGERIPVDGTVREGGGTVDEAVVTGESLPVPKTSGEAVIGGSLLSNGSLVIEVGEDATSSVSRITELVWNLQSTTHGIQQLANRLATVFVPLVLTLAVVVGIVHLGLGASPTETMLVALTVIIVSCPCALGLATPLAIASSVREALERGIVVFDETLFERLHGVDVVIFDKTGTLTTGEMRVQKATGPSALLERAALLEARVSHPIAGAITDHYLESNEEPGDGPTETVTDGGITEEAVADTEALGATDSGNDPEQGRDSRVEEFTSHPTGVEGIVDSDRLLVGDESLFVEEGWSVPDELASQATAASANGHAPVLVGTDGSAEGLVVVGDEARPNWEAVVSEVDDRDIDVAVLTGDSESAATAFRDHPAVDTVFAGVPPEAKAETVARLGADGTTVMIGDGTNDAPALARADLGIALGSATAVAVDAADVAITTDDLATLETVFELSTAANTRVKQNIGWAFFYNGVAIPLAITGLINPLFAALAMGTSSLLVVANSARSLLD